MKQKTVISKEEINLKQEVYMEERDGQRELCREFTVPIQLPMTETKI